MVFVFVASMSVSVPGGCLLVHLYAKSKKIIDRGIGWVNKLPVCQSDKVPLRVRLHWAPLATHANLPVSSQLITLLLTFPFYFSPYTNSRLFPHYVFFLIKCNSYIEKLLTLYFLTSISSHMGIFANIHMLLQVSKISWLVYWYRTYMVWGQQGMLD